MSNRQPLIAKAIIPVDLYGQSADYDVIMKIEIKFRLFVLEDAAQAFGSAYKARKALGLGHVGVTSFCPAKTLGCYVAGGGFYKHPRFVLDYSFFDPPWQG